MLKIECSTSYVQPGQWFEWTAYWNYDVKKMRKFEASLAWFTHGKGDGDSESAIDQTWRSEEPSGARKFRWQAPRAPLSFTGKLIKLNWAIEFTCPTESKTADATISHTLQITPTENEIRLALANGKEA